MLNLELARTIHLDRQREIDGHARTADLLRSRALPATTDGRAAPGPGSRARVGLRPSGRPG